MTGKGKEYDDYGRLIFDGEYLNGYKLNGKGYDSNHNIIYELKNGKEEKNGKGIEYLYNNIIFEGEYLKGKRWNGIIKQYWRNKLLFECQYINEEINGKGKEYDYENDKIIFEGEYMNGKRWNGIVFNAKDNGMYELKDGKGYIKEYNSITELFFEGEYENGKKNGKGKEYKYKNDNYELIFEGEYLNGKRWNGKQYNLELESEYLNGKIWNGIVSSHGSTKKRELKNGKVIFEGEYLKGKRWNGKEKEYDADGILKLEYEYLNGEKKF